jgi:hypothetical protein
MDTKPTRRLVLSKTTIRDLSEADLRNVVGGTEKKPTKGCVTPTISCSAASYHCTDCFCNNTANCAC